ncbi:hypothetical protein CHCC5023_0833 [Bacillus paralicheniformis]|uniref:Uncharacterized protein n=1 Tax=Bacillus paralicheniformis TaxID=1648923 RepID=A0ABY3FYA5_9BACI|nr:hypothetical protein SC10_B2orf03471 [Bacillus paralicheniformis]TWJ60716.1 hypothetical protein CHCC5023_0833 [Bacillus paralicheniformis]TWL41756.1 hypothetical protein CHCC15381_3925 [Bacillus paralicheniformis]
MMPLYFFISKQTHYTDYTREKVISEYVMRLIKWKKID